MSPLSLVMPYYLNAGMLALQYEVWRAYSPEVKAQLEIVIVDDGSPEGTAADVLRTADLPAIRIFRVLEDRPWHQHGARNLGAHVAAGPWLFLTDMDHVIPAKSMARLLEYQADPERYYVFPRLDAPDLKPTKDRFGLPKRHPNTFAMTRELYWKVGGYDEEFCGIYGTDGLFRTRLTQRAGQVVLRRSPIVRYSRDVQADASTRTLKRKDGRDPHAKRTIRDLKKREGRAASVRVLDFPWAQIV